MLTDIGPYTGNALFTGNIHGPNATGHRLPPPFPCSVCSSILWQEGANQIDLPSNDRHTWSISSSSKPHASWTSPFHPHTAYPWKNLVITTHRSYHHSWRPSLSLNQYETVPTHYIIISFRIRICLISCLIIYQSSITAKAEPFHAPTLMQYGIGNCCKILIKRCWYHVIAILLTIFATVLGFWPGERLFQAGWSPGPTWFFFHRFFSSPSGFKSKHLA